MVSIYFFCVLSIWFCLCRGGTLETSVPSPSRSFDLKLKKMTEMVVGMSIYTINGDPHRDYPVWCPTDGNFSPARIGTRINISSQTWRGRGWGFFPLSGVPDLRKLQNCSYILRKPNNSIHPVPSPLVASHLRV